MRSPLVLATSAMKRSNGTYVMMIFLATFVFTCILLHARLDVVTDLESFPLDRERVRPTHGKHRTTADIESFHWEREREREKRAMPGNSEKHRRMEDPQDANWGGKMERFHAEIMENYWELRKEFDARFIPEDSKEELIEFAKRSRNEDYEPILSADEMPYDVNNCPLDPPKDYPVAFNVLEIIENWNPDDPNPERKPRIYQGICRFDYSTELEKALNYRKKELPFVIRDDPLVLQTVQRWSDTDYLTRLLGRNGEVHRTEYSHNNHFMFWRTNKRRGNIVDGWEPPTENIKMSFRDWLQEARSLEESYDKNKDHWYFRLNSCEREQCLEEKTNYLHHEVPFLSPKKSFYIVNPNETRGINCRFGMKGVIAENHYDGSRNMVGIMYGERRYILGHPEQCPNFCLYENPHPSSRHSAVDWSDPDLDKFPQFASAQVNEIVLQAGDVLYLPTFWFHYIISLGINYQCNGRSGDTRHYQHEIKKCGF